MTGNHLFNGFSPETLSFLRDIKENNNKSWFEANKQRYQTYLLKPFQDLVTDLSGFMLSIDPLLVTTPAVSKTISRIYRDTRFSKDKSLYRSTIWLTFKRQNDSWKEAPAYYFEITPESYRYGMGFYNAAKPFMDRFRQLLDENAAAFLKVITFYQQDPVFTLEGEKYKKILAPDQSELIQDWYQRKNFYLVCNRTIDSLLFSRGLVEHLIDGFGTLAPLYHYLWRIKTQVDKCNQFKRFDFNEY